MSSSVPEITRDIVAALLSNPSYKPPTGGSDEVGKYISDVYTAVYDTVKKKMIGG